MVCLNHDRPNEGIQCNAFDIHIGWVQLFVPLNHNIWYEYNYLYQDMGLVQKFVQSAQYHTPQPMVYPLVQPPTLSMKSITYDYFKLISQNIAFWHGLCNNKGNKCRIYKQRAFCPTWLSLQFHVNSIFYNLGFLVNGNLSIIRIERRHNDRNK